MKPFRRLRQNAVVPGRPLLTVARWLSWLLHCLLRKTAKVQFSTAPIQMNLVPRLKSFGSTSIFIRRDLYEAELPTLQRLIERGSTVIDIGGSFGIYTLFLQHIVGETGCVITFEPGKTSFELLQSNLALNNVRNVRAYKLAIGHQTKTSSLYHIANSPVNYSLAGLEGSSSETVEVVTLDDFASKHIHAQVSFIKMDIEGCEYHALLGAKQLLTTSRPRVMFEVSFGAMTRAGIDKGAPFDFLRALGYDFFALDCHSDLMPILRPTEGNIFAFPAEGRAIRGQFRGGGSVST